MGSSTLEESSIPTADNIVTPASAASFVGYKSVEDIARLITILHDADAAHFEAQCGALTQLLDAAWQPGFLETLPLPFTVQVVQVISNYFAFSDTNSEQQAALVKAARGKVLATLLHLYKAIEHSHQRTLDADSKSCCRACHLALSSLLNICSQQPTFVQSEAFASHQRGACHNSHTTEPTKPSAQRPELVPTPLLKELVVTAQEALKHCQPCLVPDVAWDGSTKGYKQGWAPADPCPSAPHSSTGQEPASSLLEKWVKLLTAIAVSGKLAARELHRCRVLDFLQEVLDVCGSRPASLVQAVEAAYGALARQSQAAARDMLDAPLVTALTGIALHSKQPSLVLAALDRLIPLIDSCSGADYLRVMRPTGIVAAVHQLMLSSCDAAHAQAGHDVELTESGTVSAAARDGPHPQLAHPWDAAVAAAAAARSQEPGCSTVPDFSLPQTGALKDAAQCILLACLDRSRRQAGLQQKQAPRTGYWALVRPRELLMLEDRLSRRPACAAVQPVKPAAASQKTTSKLAGDSSSLGDAAADDEFDEDGVRVVWDSTPSEHVRAARTKWRSMQLRDLISWSQTSDEVNAWILIPKGTAKHEVDVAVSPQHLCVKLGWHGRFLDGPLVRRVKSKDSIWCLAGADESGRFDTLHIMMPKDTPKWWRSLFEGSEEKSHMELLKEAVNADERVVGYDEMDEGAKEIFDDLRERQALVASGCLDLENSFDDFRVVIGDGTL